MVQRTLTNTTNAKSKLSSNTNSWHSCIRKTISFENVKKRGWNAVIFVTLLNERISNVMPSILGKVDLDRTTKNELNNVNVVLLRACLMFILKWKAKEFYRHSVWFTVHVCHNFAQNHSHCVLLARLHFAIQSIPTDSILWLLQWPVIRFLLFSVGLPTSISHFTTKSSVSSLPYTFQRPECHHPAYQKLAIIYLAEIAWFFFTLLSLLLCHTVCPHICFQSFHLIHFIWSAFITLLVTFFH